MTEILNHLSPVWTHLTEIQPDHAEGIYIYDSDGNRFTDFTSGIGVTNTGHCHPRIVQAIQEQSKSLIFGQMNIVIPPVSVALTNELNQITPPSIDTFFLSNSGAEAVEASIKLARHATGKRGVIVFQGSFHGRTAQTMAMTTSKYIYRHDYQPLPSAIYVAPFPYSYSYGWSDEQTTDFCLQQLDILEELQDKYPVIGDVRGLGLMVATEFTKDGKPAKEMAKAVQKACLKRNLLLLTCGTFENVIRWIPPLIVSEEQIIEAVSIFQESLAEVMN